MGQIVTEAIRAGQWVDIPEPTEDQQLGPVTVQTQSGNLTIMPITLEFVRAANLLYDRGLAERVTDNHGRNYLKPTEKLIEFFGQRIGFEKSQ